MSFIAPLSLPIRKTKALLSSYFCKTPVFYKSLPAHPSPYRLQRTAPFCSMTSTENNKHSDKPTSPWYLLKHSELLKSSSFIDGVFTPVVSPASDLIQIIDPRNSLPIHSVQDSLLNNSYDEILMAKTAAHSAFPTWSSLSIDSRCQFLSTIATNLESNISDLATIISLENGKTFQQAVEEVKYSTSFFHWCSQPSLYSSTTNIQRFDAVTSELTTKIPVGVVATITPWNFPLAMLARKLAAALAAGCTVVAKPSEITPLSALALAQILKQSQIPNGVFNVVVSNHGAKVSEKLLCENGVNMLSFTGSTRVGRLVAERASAYGIKTVVELGGNAPFIVFRDANIEQAVNDVVTNKIRCSGQTCVSVNRIIVEDEIHDVFVRKLVQRVKSIKTTKHSDIDDTNIVIGPMIHSQAANRVRNLVADAVSKGARFEIGENGQSDNNNNNAYMEPTVVTNVSDDMALAATEIFGPVWAVCRPFSADSSPSLVERCNKPDAGLAAYVYGKDTARMHQLVHGLKFGMVGINAPSVGGCATPFGGLGDAGYGREGGMQAIDTYTQTKFIRQNFK